VIFPIGIAPVQTCPHDRNWIGHADRIRSWTSTCAPPPAATRFFATWPRHVAGRTIYLRRILARKRRPHRCRCTPYVKETNNSPSIAPHRRWPGHDERPCGFLTGNRLMSIHMRGTAGTVAGVFGQGSFEGRSFGLLHGAARGEESGCSGRARRWKSNLRMRWRGRSSFVMADTFGTAAIPRWGNHRPDSQHIQTDTRGIN